MEPSDADAYLGRVLRGSPSGTRLARSQALSTNFLFLELRHKVEIHRMTGRVVECPIDEMNRPRGSKDAQLLGTGPGWQAGLLAHRLGDANVVTVEVDPVVAEAARRRPAAAGLHPLAVAGDAAEGYPSAVPYDRVTVTFGARRIPYAWLRQTRPGGMVLLPWGTHFGNGDALLRLTVHQGGTATGPFLRPVDFMKMRFQRLVWPFHTPDPAFAVDESTTRTALPDLGRFDPFPLAVGLRLHHVTHAVQPRDDGRTLWLCSLSNLSWAGATFHDGQDVAQVRQYGPRRLGNEFEAVFHWWVDNDLPGVECFGLTVDERGRRGWLDSPDNPVA
ncbi:protein-L-isoaspartate(D-aspartate) O-methyltransferase [Kitasatospora sp. GP82]|uniref:protein-L-isoaspartate(D-aspartate) O-methyltransferase n=1 Tax=Kitasatospora sp. GP82 TaxID=3035089 RepID=UPI002473A6DA|nr:protein-L-isoaspartate(D-aspartate) O-methyltransferase [Kitasatospora sp. GP82]